MTAGGCGAPEAVVTPAAAAAAAAADATLWIGGAGTALRSVLARASHFCSLICVASSSFCSLIYAVSQESTEGRNYPFENVCCRALNGAGILLVEAPVDDPPDAPPDAPLPEPAGAAAAGDTTTMIEGGDTDAIFLQSAASGPSLPTWSLRCSIASGSSAAGGTARCRLQRRWRRPA